MDPMADAAATRISFGISVGKKRLRNPAIQHFKFGPHKLLHFSLAYSFPYIVIFICYVILCHSNHINSSSFKNKKRL